MVGREQSENDIYEVRYLKELTPLTPTLTPYSNPNPNPNPKPKPNRKPVCEVLSLRAVSYTHLTLPMKRIV